MANALYIEISVVGICLLLIVLLSQNRTIGTTNQQRQFNRVVYATLVMLIVDALCWLVDGSTFLFAHTLNAAVETVYYFFLIFIPFLWGVYVECTLGQVRQCTRRNTWLLAVPLCVLTVYLLVTTAAGAGRVFVIDEANYYHRMLIGLIYPIVSYAYMVHASARCIVAARSAGWHDEKRLYYSLAFFAVPPAVAGLIQIFFYGVTLIWIFVAVSIMIMYIDVIVRQISTDPLTGINNRRELTKHILRVTREPVADGVLALIMMDADNFKQVNDTCGHYYGDSFILHIAELLKQSCKNTAAFLARYGGDEFCIVYPAANTAAVDAFIEAIQKNIRQWNQENDEPFNIELSIGYSIWQPKTGSVDDLYTQADQMMYRVKNAKKRA